MIELAVALFFIFLLRYKTQRPWIWVIPNAGIFALGFVMSITWLSGTPAEGLGFWEYRILGFAPLFLFLGPLGGYWLYGKTNRSGISNIPVFIGCLGACLCIWYVADYLPQISQ